MTNGDLDTSFIAASIAVSRSQLNKKLIEITGLSAAEHIKQFRLRRVLELLKNPSDSLKTVAYSSGYSNYLKFWRTVWRYFYVCPIEIRREILQTKPTHYKISFNQGNSFKRVLDLINSNRWVGELLKNLLDCIEDESLTLEKLSQRMNMSQSQLERQTIKYCLVPPFSILVLLKLAMAAQLLKKSSMAIGTVSHQVGFYDHSQFCRYFKKYYGLPPSRFREESILNFSITKLRKILNNKNEI